MKLRTKSIMVFIIIWTVVYLLIQFVVNPVLLNNYLQLEQTQIYKNMDYMEKTLLQTQIEMNTLASEWASLNESTPLNFDNYMTHLKIKYNTRKDTMQFLLVFDADKKLKLTETILPEGVISYFVNANHILKSEFANNKESGLIATSLGWMTVILQPIVVNKKDPVSKGMLILGREFNLRKINSIVKTADLSFNFYNLAAIESNPALDSIFKTVIDKKQYYISRISNSIMMGYALLSDISNKPIGMFSVSLPRTIYLNGLNTIDNFMLLFVLIGLVISIIALAFQHFTVIYRLERFNKEIMDISEHKQFSKRVTYTGKDELTSMAKEVNHMLVIVDKTHEQLEERVTDRTKTLQKTNIQLQEEMKERERTQEELLKNKELLAHLAHFDSLTDLPNRLLFNDVINKAISKAKRSNELLAVLFLDLDRFKHINDALGHPVGDDVLKSVGALFSKVIRTNDTLARLGGDEFIFLLEDIGQPNAAMVIATKLLATLNSAPIIIKNRTFYLKASIGISIYPHDGVTLEDLQRNADMAMYRAKHNGGNNFQFYKNEMNLHAHKIIELDTSLRKALAQNELQVFYQPKVAIKNYQIIGVEALARWYHPELGFIPPSEFIPIAEETTLIQDIGAFILKKACLDNKQWQDKGYQPIVVCVNLSGIRKSLTLLGPGRAS